MKLYNTEWIDIFTNMRAESMDNDWSDITWTIQQIDRNAETGNGENVHDVYEMEVTYSELIENEKEIMENALRTERIVKTYKTDKGLTNYLVKNFRNSNIDAVIL